MARNQPYFFSILDALDKKKCALLTIDKEMNTLEDDKMAGIYSWVAQHGEEEDFSEDDSDYHYSKVFGGRNRELESRFTAVLRKIMLERLHEIPHLTEEKVQSMKLEYLIDYLETVTGLNSNATQ